MNNRRVLIGIRIRKRGRSEMIKCPWLEATTAEVEIEKERNRGNSIKKIFALLGL